MASRELNVQALSAEEWNYLRGLYLTDGCSFIPKAGSPRRDCRVIFYLGINEADEAMANKVFELTTRAGLKPRIEKNAQNKNMITVTVYSRPLATFLPDRKALRGGEADTVTRFLEENDLFRVTCGIPFVAGLLDGDGCCQAIIEKGEGRSPLGALNYWKWSFIQHKYMFLVEYLKGFVECLAPNSIRTWVRRNGFAVLYIRKSGIKALLGAGIAKHSFKVARWLRMVGKARGERAKYLTTGQVARMLNVNVNSVERWIRKSKMRCFRKPTGEQGGSLSWCYIPVGEVERLKEVLARKRKGDRRGKLNGQTERFNNEPNYGSHEKAPPRGLELVSKQEAPAIVQVRMPSKVNLADGGNLICGLQERRLE